MTAHNPSIEFIADDRACAVIDRAYRRAIPLTSNSFTPRITAISFSLERVFQLSDDTFHLVLIPRHRIDPGDSNSIKAVGVRRRRIIRILANPPKRRRVADSKRDTLTGSSNRLEIGPLLSGNLFPSGHHRVIQVSALRLRVEIPSARGIGERENTPDLHPLRRAVCGLENDFIDNRVDPHGIAGAQSYRRQYQHRSD